MRKNKSLAELSNEMQTEIYKRIRKLALEEANRKEQELIKKLLKRIIEEKPFEWIPNE